VPSHVSLICGSMAHTSVMVHVPVVRVQLLDSNSFGIGWAWPLGIRYLCQNNAIVFGNHWAAQM
jgi:hypothetical protein